MDSHIVQQRQISSRFSVNSSQMRGVFSKGFTRLGEQLGRSIVIEKGRPLRKEDRVEQGDIPVIAGGKSSPYKHNAATHAMPCITVSASGAAGYVWFHEEPIWASDCYVIYSKEHSIEYLYFALKHQQSRIYALQSGGAQPHVYIRDLKRLPLFLPPLEEQKRIASILQACSQLIKKTEALIQAKEQQFQWLVSRLIPSNQSQSSWEKQAFGHYIEEKKEKSQSPNLYPCLTSSRRGIFLQKEYFSKQIASKNNTGYKIIARGDFTYRSMSDDSVFVFNQQNILNKGLISPAYAVFTPNNNMDSDFLYYFLNSISFKRVLRKEIQGGTRTALKLSKLKKLEVRVPKLAEQQKITSILQVSREEIHALKKLLKLYQFQQSGMMQRLLQSEDKYNV